MTDRDIALGRFQHVTTLPLRLLRRRPRRELLLLLPHRDRHGRARRRDGSLGRVKEDPVSLIIAVHNLSNLAPVSDYRVEVYISRTKIAEGIVRGHTRDDGWRELLRKIIDSPDVRGVDHLQEFLDAIEPPQPPKRRK
jgi:hypothetical protein